MRARATRVWLLGILLVTGLVTGCVRTGSVGTTSRGGLTRSAELPRAGEGFHWLRTDDHHHGVPRFVETIERAAGKVARERPGANLAVGDISAPAGGALMPHLSHRSGRDADLLLYLTTLDGAPVESPGFIHVGPDGLARDEKNKRFLRFDVEREWLLVKHLLEDPEGRIQWVFANHNVKALLLQWALARGDSGETLVRAQEVLLEPHPGGPHDDHIHIRTTCSPAEVASGCQPTGPHRAWIDALDTASPASDPELLDAIVRPL